MAFLLSAFVAANAQVVKTVALETAKHLRDVISSEEATTVDSIAVTSGLINSDDIRFLAYCCEQGRLTGVDLSLVEISGNGIPDRAFCPSKINSDNPGDTPVGFTNKLRHLRLPLNLRSIGELAFFSTELVEIDIPRTVETIGSNAFGSCSKLAEVVLHAPDAKCVAAGYAFGANAKNLRLAVPAGSAGSFAAAPGWSGFGKITEREGLYTIRRVNLDGGGIASLLGSSLLTTDSLIVSGNLCSDDFAAMRKASGDGRLTGIDLSSCTADNNAIPDRAFNMTGEFDTKDPRKRRKLLYVTLPSVVTSIGDYAFSGNRQLRSIQIPSSVTYIGENAYYGCVSASGSVTVPEGVSRLMVSTFESCGSLTEVRLPSTLSLADVKSLRLQPDYVESGWSTSFYVNRMTPPELAIDKDWSAFGHDAPEDLSGDLRNSTLYVPVGAKAAYEADELWSCFGNIVETAELDGGTSGIEATAVSAKEQTDNRLYTLDGRYAGNDMSRLGKGIYVVNGKKVVR